MHSSLLKTGLIISLTKNLPLTTVIPTLAVWLWGINVLVFHQSRINHVFILDFKPSSALGFTAIFKLAALLSSIFCLPFFLTYASIGGLVAFQNLDAVKIYPLLLIILNFVLLLIPFVFYSSTRWFESLSRISSSSP